MSQLIVSRLILMNSGVVKMSITNINAILLELQTEVTYQVRPHLFQRILRNM